MNNFFRIALINDIISKSKLAPEAEAFLSWLKSLPKESLKRIHIVDDCSLSKHSILLCEKSESLKYGDIRMSSNMKSPDVIFSMLKNEVIPLPIEYIRAMNEMSSGTAFGAKQLMKEVSRILSSTSEDIMLSVAFDSAGPQLYPDWYTKQCEPNKYIEYHDVLKGEILEKKNSSMNAPLEKLPEKTSKGDKKKESTPKGVEPKEDRSWFIDTPRLDHELKLMVMRGELEHSLEMGDWTRCKAVKDSIDHCVADWERG